mgnify:CR=1 FL=1
MVDNHNVKLDERFDGLDWKGLSVAFEYARQNIPEVRENPAIFVAIAIFRDLTSAGVSSKLAFRRAERFAGLFDYMHDTLMEEVISIGRKLVEDHSKGKKKELAKEVEEYLKKPDSLIVLPGKSPLENK